MTLRVLVRGGGDLSSGAIMRMHRAGWQVLVAELAQPLAVRRYVAFAQAVFEGEMQIEDVRARRVSGLEAAREAFTQGVTPVLVDPDLESLAAFKPHVLVDGRMRKQPPGTSMDIAELVIGLGPGFTAGVDCHAVIETNRGPFLGRVIWEGQAQADTGVPEQVGAYRAERVLRAPADGVVEPLIQIGAQVRRGDVVARVSGQPVTAPFNGVLRGLLQGGLWVPSGEKIGDLDPRGDPLLSRMVSEKALAVGGGVLEAVLVWAHRRGYELRSIR